jgi:hypothetical protein
MSKDRCENLLDIQRREQLKIIIIKKSKLKYSGKPVASSKMSGFSKFFEDILEARRVSSKTIKRR